MAATALPSKRELAGARLVEITRPRLNKYIPHVPTERQQVGLLLQSSEILYGGAAGGGKTDWLAMGALQYVDVHKYAALLLRRTYQQASKADAIIPRLHEWLQPTDAHWDGLNSTWRFPSKATLEIGHCQFEKDKYNFQGGQYQFVGFDELTQFTLSQYTYLFSRTRRLEGNAKVPIRHWAGSNPGGEGHVWVRDMFLVQKEPDRVFLPARLHDNPYLDAEEYIKSLSHLDPTTRAQLLEGDWEVRDKGSLFDRDWFEIVKAAPASRRTIRAWDLAAINPRKQKKAKAASVDGDYISGCLMSEHDGVFYIEDIRRKRTTPSGIRQMLKQSATLDGKATTIWIEQEPGSSGVIVIDTYVRLLVGWNVRGQPPSGDKIVRAAPLSAQAEAGNVKLVEGPWNRAFLEEMELIGTESAAFDDQCDSASLSFSKLAEHIQVRGGVAA